MSGLDCLKFSDTKFVCLTNPDRILVSWDQVELKKILNNIKSANKLTNRPMCLT